MKPHEVYNLPLGARELLYAFIHYELEQRIKEQKDLNKGYES